MEKDSGGSESERAGGGDSAVSGRTRIVLRPIASSLPVGFFAFSTGSLLLSALQLGWVPPTESASLYALVLAFVAPLEVLAGVLAYLARDAGAATALTMLGAAWTGTAVVALMRPAEERSLALAVFLPALAAFILALSVAALPGKPMLGVLLMLASGSRKPASAVNCDTREPASEQATGSAWRKAGSGCRQSATTRT